MKIFLIFLMSFCSSYQVEDLSDCEKGQEFDTYCIKKCNNDSDCQTKEFCSTKKICLPLYDPERVDEGCR